jgi:hypothetical protein
LKDLEQMTSEFEKIMMSELADDEAEDSRTELQAKKLMTVAKSKYYMLKVNYPDLASKIDDGQMH